MAFTLPNFHISFPPPSIPSKTTQHYNCIISASQSQQNPQLLLHQSQDSSTSTFTSTSTSSSANVSKPKKLTIQSRLSQLCKDGRPNLARRLFDALPRPNTLLWNTIIIGFVCNGMPHDALRFYTRMNDSPIAAKSDFYTYSSALKACAETRQLKLGKSIHCKILRTQLKPNRILSNSLLNMYSTCLSPLFEEADLKFPPFDAVLILFDRMRKRNVVTWNTMIDWYVKTGRPLEALMQFKIMIKLGVMPTVVSFINIFPAVAAIQDRRNSDVLYGFLLKLGPDYVNNLFAISSAIFMYSELSDVLSARRVFDCSVGKNIEVWNTMINGYVQNDQADEALHLFLQILYLEQFVPDAVTFLTALMAVSQIQCLELGQQIHAYIIKYLMALPVIISNALIVMYSRCDAVEMAFVAFDKMLERDLVSWNTMVSSFAQNGFDVEGLMLVYEMQKQGFFIDSVTATALLSAASNLGDLRIGKQTHAYLFRHGIEFEGMDSYLIDMYAKSCSINTAERLFEKNNICERDQVTWNAMIAGYTQNGQIEQAVAVFRQMLKQNIFPNSVTLASVLPACNPMGDTGTGKQLHSFAVRHSLDKNVFVGTALVDMYSKCGEIDYAERLFNGMQERSSVTFTTMISGYGQHGLGERALSLFYAMLKDGMKPDAVTFVAVLSACSYAGLVDEGLKIFNSMEEEYGIPTMPEHYSCVVDMLGRAGRVVEAYEYVREMDMEGNLVGIWGSLLSACRVHREFELGKLVAERLFEMDKGNGMAGYHVLLSNIYAEEGKWDGVDGVRKGMRQKGLRKEAGCSWIEVGGIVHYFMSGDQRHPQGDEIYVMLDELVMEMKAAGYRLSVCSSMDEVFERD